MSVSRKNKSMKKSSNSRKNIKSSRKTRKNIRKMRGGRKGRRNMKGGYNKLEHIINNTKDLDKYIEDIVKNDPDDEEELDMSKMLKNNNSSIKLDIFIRDKNDKNDVLNFFSGINFSNNPNLIDIHNLKIMSTVLKYNQNLQFLDLVNCFNDNTDNFENFELFINQLRSKNKTLQVYNKLESIDLSNNKLFKLDGNLPRLYFMYAGIFESNLKKINIDNDSLKPEDYNFSIKNSTYEPFIEKEVFLKILLQKMKNYFKSRDENITKYDTPPKLLTYVGNQVEKILAKENQNTSRNKSLPQQANYNNENEHL
jgi:hypothetical protein